MGRDGQLTARRRNQLIFCKDFLTFALYICVCFLQSRNQIPPLAVEETKLQSPENNDENPDDQKVLEILTQKLRDATSIQEIETLTALILKIKVAQQELDIARLRLEEHRNTKFDRKINHARQILGLAIGVALAAGGPFVLLYVDTYLGTFLMGIGFTSLGLSSRVAKSFFEKANNKR